MACAVIDTQTNLVINTIVADAERDLPPLGCMLVTIPEGMPVDSSGWLWDGAQFIAPIVDAGSGE